MAAGFKHATVNPSDVPGTLTNYPTFIDPARLGITTLAEVQSSRLYADSGKVVEWAREALLTEIWAKVPSLTSTTTAYVDWDGVRADYAVTDTYGRNQVWPDYLGVFHLQDTSGSAVNSVGSNNMTVTGSPTYSVPSRIGNGIDYSGTGQYHRSTSGGTTDEPLTIQAQFNADTVTGALSIAATGTNVGDDQALIVVNGSLWALSQGTSNVQAQGATSLSTGVWYMGHAVYRASGILREIYLNGTSDGTNSTAQAVGAGTAMYIADRPRTAGSQIFNGKIDEVRFRASELSANWITTEYNNQSDEAGFWGTWSDVATAKRGGILSFF